MHDPILHISDRKQLYFSSKMYYNKFILQAAEITVSAKRK